MTVDWTRFSDTVETKGNQLLGLNDAAFEQLGAVRAASNTSEVVHTIAQKGCMHAMRDDTTQSPPSRGALKMRRKTCMMKSCLCGQSRSCRSKPQGPPGPSGGHSPWLQSVVRVRVTLGASYTHARNRSQVVAVCAAACGGWYGALHVQPGQARQREH